MPSTPLVRKKGRGQFVEEPLRQEGKRVRLPPLPPHPLPKVIAVLPKYSWNSSSSWYYLILQPSGVLHEKKIAGNWKSKAGTYNKAKGWHCQPTIPSDDRDWRKPLPGSFHGREKEYRLQTLWTFLWRNHHQLHKKACEVYAFNPERGRSAELPVAGWMVRWEEKPHPGEGCCACWGCHLLLLPDVTAHSREPCRPSLPRSPLLCERHSSCGSLHLSVPCMVSEPGSLSLWA